MSNLSSNFHDWWPMYLKWKCLQMNATGPYWWQVNIGSGNGLVPEGTKPLTGPLLPQMCRHMAWSGHNELLINSYDCPVILFGLCDLEVGLMTLEYHRAPLIFSSKLYASFRIERCGDHLWRTVDRSLPRLMGALLRAWLHLRHGAFWGCAPAPLTKLGLIDWLIDSHRWIWLIVWICSNFSKIYHRIYEVFLQNV